MSNAINYRPFMKSRRVFNDVLYIDHAKHTPWQNIKELFKLRTQTIKAKMTLMFDEREQLSKRTKQVRQQLRSVGISGLDLLKPETYSITSILKPGEDILAAVCGKVNNEGTALLVVTSMRVVYLNQIPFFTTMDEVSYDVVTGVSSSIGQWDAQITLHTRIKDFILRSVKLEAANNFIYVVEKYCIDIQNRIQATPVSALANS